MSAIPHTYEPDCECLECEGIRMRVGMPLLAKSLLRRLRIYLFH